MDEDDHSMMMVMMMPLVPCEDERSRPARDAGVGPGPTQGVHGKAAVVAKVPGLRSLGNIRIRV